MTLGEKIRDCRIRAGLSQEKLAEHIDVYKRQDQDQDEKQEDGQRASSGRLRGRGRVRRGGEQGGRRRQK